MQKQGDPNIIVAMAEAKPGRPRTLTKHSVELLKQQVEARDIRQDSFTPTSFAKAVVDAMKIQSLIATGRDDQVKAPSSRTIYRLRKEIAPVTVSEACVQNERRMIVGMDIRNALSCAAMAKLVMDPANELVRMALLTNTDVTSIQLERSTGTVIAGKHAAERLKSEGKSISRTMEGMQSRCVSIMTTISAAGELLCTIIIIRDAAVQSFSKHLVSNYLIPHLPLFLFSSHTTVFTTVVTYSLEVIRPLLSRLLDLYLLLQTT